MQARRPAVFQGTVMNLVTPFFSTWLAAFDARLWAECV